MNHWTIDTASPRPTHVVALVLAGFLWLSGLQSGCAAQGAAADSPHVAAVAAPASPATRVGQGVPFDVSWSPDQLDQLVAAIALYPDELVAQILAAATYPTQVVEADRWMQSHSDLVGDSLAAAVDTQTWDGSVKALVQFPSVLAMMDKNLSWTSALGEAFVNDSQALMGAVQQMRVRAQQAGNLKSTPEQNVTTADQSLAIEPADPDFVYVPEYDPWLVYGEPIALYPDWVDVPGLFFAGPGIDFGLGIGVGVFGGFGWGWHHWGADWHHHHIDHNHAPYVSRSPTFRDHHQPGSFGHPAEFPHGAGAAGFHPRGFTPPETFHPGALSGGGLSGMHAGAFSGFDHGGIVGGFSARGRASVGGFHGGSAGGFHGGGGHR